MLVDFLLRIMADWLVVAVVLAGAAGMWFGVPPKQRYQAFARGLMAGLVALLAAKIISLLYQGERPFVALGMAPKASYLDNPGFPSDHVLFVLIITAVVWASTKNQRLLAAMLLGCALIGVGRILALVHTPADVLGGVLCAAAAAAAVYGRRLWR